MKAALLVLAGLLLPALDEKKSVEVACPLDGHRFRALDVTSFDYARGWGGIDRDLCKHAFKTTPLELFAWMCPSCGFAGTKADFDPKSALSEDEKKAILGRLKPAVGLRKDMKQDAVPGHAKFDLMAQVSVLRGAPPEKAAAAWLHASWCARQQGAVPLDAFDEWIEMRREFNLEVLPLDLKDKNRTDLELTVAAKIEHKIDERREAEKRDVQTVKDAEARIAEERQKPQPDEALIRKEEARRGDARGRLHYGALLKYCALHLWRRHGENPQALRWIEELRRAKGDNSVIDDAVEKTAASIDLERSYQRKAIEQYERAVAGGKLERPAEAHFQYLLGELFRRLGEKEKAAERYRKAMEEPSVRKTAEEQLKLVE